jgi:hypothetical protein
MAIYDADKDRRELYESLKSKISLECFKYFYNCLDLMEDTV